MFAIVMTFDDGSAENVEAGISHVEDEVLPALRDASGLQGWWLVDRVGNRRVSLMVWDNDEHYNTAMAMVQEARAKDPDRRRPPPSSVGRFEIYGTIGHS